MVSGFSRGVPSVASSALVLVVAADEALGGEQHQAAQSLCRDAFDGDFGVDDWAHTQHGTRVLALLDGRLVGHAAVVPRRIDLDAQAFRAGYLEGVAVAPDLRRRGLGHRVVEVATELVRSGFDLGVLSSGVPAFYEPLGWQRWRGPSFVREQQGIRRTADEDGDLLVLRVGRTARAALTGRITCDARPGDDW